MHKTYVIHSAGAIHSDITLIPEVGGLYAFSLKDPSVLAEPLARAGLTMDVMGLGQRPLIYIGASGDSPRQQAQKRHGHGHRRSARLPGQVLLGNGLCRRALPEDRVRAFQGTRLARN